MKLYLKHIINSIREKPLQPLLIVVCIALAVAIFVASYLTTGAYDRYNRMLATYAVGSADIKVEVKSGADLRYLQAGEFKELVGDAGNVMGIFKLSLFQITENDAIFASVAAVEFESLNDFFKFRVLDFGALTSVNKDESVLLSKNYAEANGLSVGDVVSVGIVGYSVNYTVQGIYESEGLMYSTDMLVSHESVLRKIKASLGFYMFDGDFRPDNYILIDLFDDNRTQEFIDKISADERFSNASVTTAVETGAAETYVFTASVIVYFIAVVFACLVVLLIYSGLTVITGNRSAEIALFRGVGATRNNMLAMQFVECLIYAAIGSLLGVALSFLPAKLFSNIFAFEGMHFSIEWDSVLLGIAFGLVIPILSLSILLAKDAYASLDGTLKGESKLFKRVSLRVVLVVFAVAALGAILFAVVPVSAYYYPALIVFIAVIVLASMVLPFLSGGLFSLLNATFKRAGKGGFARVAMKTSQVNLGFQNFQRIICITVALFSLILYAVSYAQITSERMSNLVKSPVAVLNVSVANSSLADGIDSAEQYSFASLKRGNSLPNGIALVLASVNTYAHQAVNIGMVDVIPSGNEILLPASVTASLDKQIGDDIVIVVGGQDMVFRIAGVFESDFYMGIVDNKYLGTNLDMLLLQPKDGVSAEELFKDATDVYGTQSTQIVYTSSITEDVTSLIDKFVALIRALVIMGTLVGIFGCVNSYVEQYRNRKEEFNQLKNIGMTKRELVGTLTIEGVANTLVAVSFGLLIGGVFIGLARLGLLAFGVSFSL